ncbi:endonuclease/exonuclease/phosphatase [Haloferula helveola]|uniref:Endonuclease/exonuclease/phosphatase n=1 Tax=Haloferula helveola TaxID=490095 RepID=A0ABN6GZJ0_9BACT|nr:endonuclease/exonuclease/phosphatase [Haloferula helveola]
MNLRFIALAVAASPSVLPGVTLLLEDFEDSTVGYTTSISETSDGSNDYFGRVAPDGISVGTNIVYSNLQGSGYFGGQDMDANGTGDPNAAGAQATITWTGIDITGYGNLRFSAFWAEDDDGTNEDWDSADDFVLVEFQIDGGGFQNLFAIENDGTTFNTAPLIDTDFDGIGDGAVITDSFTRYFSTISGTGSSLDLRITIDLDSGDEDIAFDNVMIESIPEPGIALLGSLGLLGLLRRRRSA